ncbi:MAG: hypothetical protein IJP29_00210 [Lachnospiraceae bacterium]|nr:hypothetical protein [Lachnospiraceae bacterium]
MNTEVVKALIDEKGWTANETFENQNDEYSVNIDDECILVESGWKWQGTGNGDKAFSCTDGNVCQWYR